MKSAVFLYDFTGIMSEPWLKAGYHCFLIDGQHPEGLHTDPENPLLHRMGIWLDHFKSNESMRYITARIPIPEIIFGFPECTDLAVSGAAHFQKKRLADPLFQVKAVDNALLVRDLGNQWGCKWAFENPVSVIATKYRKPDFYFHPWEYGGYITGDGVHPTYPDYIAPFDAYPKYTAIWHGNGFVEPERKPVAVKPGYSTQHRKLGGKSLKTKNIRSATPRGFAEAVFQANSVSP